MTLSMDEMAILAMYNADTKSKTIEKMIDVLPYIEDSDITSLVCSTIKKTLKMSDNEFQKLDLENFIFEKESEE